jgi:hypothetical protein
VNERRGESRFVESDRAVFQQEGRAASTGARAYAPHCQHTGAFVQVGINAFKDGHFAEFIGLVIEAG